MAQQIKKKFLSSEVIEYFDDQIDAVEQLAQDLEQEKADLTYVDEKDEELSEAIESEAQARQEADEDLQSQIDTEVSAREAADLSLQASVDQLSAEDVALNAKIDQEISAREAADAALQSQLENIISNTDPESLDSLSEIVEAFQNADGNLNQLITDLGTSSASALQSEVERALAEEARIESKIDQEILDREASVSSESLARQAADTILQEAIAAEESARIAADSLKEDAVNKSTDNNLGDSDVLFPTQKAVKDHVANKEKDLSTKLLTGKSIESLLPVAVNVETADRHYSGGVAHALESDYICYFTDQSLVFVNSQNPFGVEIYKTLNFSTASNNFPQCITSIGNFVFMAMANGRLYTIDWSDLQNPVIVGFVAIGSGQHYDIATDGENTLFLANTTNNRVYFVDITNRTAPTLISSIALGGFGTGVAFENGYLYVTNYSNKLHTMAKNPDTSVWEQVAVLDTITNPNRCRVVQNSRGEKLLFAMRYLGVDAAFFNISNPAEPTEVKRLTAPSAMQIYAIAFSHENMVHVGLTNGTVGGFSIIDISDPKYAGSYTPVNPDGSKKFSEMRVLIKTKTKTPYFKDKSLLLATGVRVGGTSTQKTTAPIQLPVINHDLVELLARPTSSSVSGSIASEAQARIDADNALDARLDVIEGSSEGSIAKALQDSKEYTDQKVSDLVGSAPEVLDTLKELADALGGDENFAATVASQIGSISEDLSALETSVESSVTSLQSQIDELSGQVGQDLQQAISDLEDAISQEASARITADSSLQADLSDLDAYAQDIRSDVDDLDAYAQDIRSDVDDHETRIQSLEALTDGPIFHKAKIVIADELSFVELPHLAIENSIVASVARLMIHKDEDFTVSVVSGVTRLTFINSLANPDGEEKIESGDVIFVTYAVTA